jgi:adenylate cyclase
VLNFHAELNFQKLNEDRPLLQKFLTKSLRQTGLVFIFSFALLCILTTTIRTTEMEQGNIFDKILAYTHHYSRSFEERFYDFRKRSLLDPNFKSNEITLIKIDDYSLQKIGSWPIPRTIHAEMIDQLSHFGAKVVSLDIFYPERSPDYGKVSPDKVFINSIKNFKKNGGEIFIAYTSVNNAEEALNEAPDQMLDHMINTRGEANLSQMKINKYTFPIPEILESGAGLGNIHAEQDPDGIFRQYQLVSNIDTIYYGSMALNAYEAYIGEKKNIKIFKDENGISAELEIDQKKLEISENGQTKIRYVGGIDQFNAISIYDLIKAKKNDPKMIELIKDKMVFVGSTAFGAHDLRPTAIDPQMPGVYSHLNMTHMLLHKYFFQKNSDSLFFSILFLIISMIIFLFVQTKGNAFLDAIIVIAIVIFYHLADKYYYFPQGYELKLFYSFFCILSCYSWNTFIKFYEANKEKKQIRGTFARYVAPTIVDEMLKDPEKLHVGGTKMDITCLFSDVRDFTKISEGMTATELAQSLNTYMGAMTDIVFDTKGTLDKYIGDAIVAIWGAPLKIGNHAQYAVEAAILMMNKLPEINAEFERLGRPRFNVGIGLNSGECSVGNMGSSRIFSYTALGDNMNLGARLESLCKHYGTQILISEMTLERIDTTHIKTRPIDKVVVKGKSQAVEIYEVLHENHWMTNFPESLINYKTAYVFFQKKQFSSAKDIFDHLLEKNHLDKPTKRLSELCQKYIDSPELITENFEVTVMTEK